jgi:hypothetical protein
VARHIVQQLSQENAAIQAQFKIVESERDLLLSELEQLRQVELEQSNCPCTDRVAGCQKCGCRRQDQ